MRRLRLTAGLTAGLVAGALVVGCTGGSSPRPDPPPSSSSPSSSPPPWVTETLPPEPTTRPLVLAVNPRRPRIRVPIPVAEWVIDGRIDNWRDLGEPAEPMRVTRDTRLLRHLPMDMVAIVVADAVSPAVRVVEVGGVDPLHEPDAYPIQVPGPDHPAVTTLSVVGDIMLGRRVRERAAELGDPLHALRPMGFRLAAADLTVGNLESTLSTAGPPTQGGDSFAADPRVARGLRGLGFDALDLANNHVGDFGDRALVRTVQRLRAADLPSFGAGRDLAEARRPVVLTRHGTRFGFLGFNTIGETPEAAPGQPGAWSVRMPPRTGPLDRAGLARVLHDVRRLDRRVDVVTVLPHWGTQYTNRPDPIQRRVARSLVRAGADLVVGGHPHWVQGAAMVGDALVVHSLGNFVFDMEPPETREGLVLEATFWGGRLVAADFVPYRIDRDHAPRPVRPTRAGATLERFWEFSRLGAS